MESSETTKDVAGPKGLELYRPPRDDSCESLVCAACCAGHFRTRNSLPFLLLILSSPYSTPESSGLFEFTLIPSFFA